MHRLETDNVFGQNTAAIVTLEDKYRQYWMEDV
ncbi:PPE domain-containing protein [Mycobacterium uberis]